MTDESMTNADDQVRTSLARSASTDVFYVFSETVGALRGLYGSLAFDARTAAERELWIRRSIALRKFKNEVDERDRAALLDAIAMLRAEREFLTQRGLAAGGSA